MEHPHPLSDFKFCPHCGGAQFHEHDAHSKRCATCGFTFYPNANTSGSFTIEYTLPDGTPWTPLNQTP